MSVPTISSVTPNVGHSGGKTLVQIVGTNFNLPPAPPATGVTTAPGPSVRVRFGGLDATQVEVYSATSLYCLTAKAPDHDNPEAAVAVEVTNLDTVGAPIAGETVTLAAGFTHQRPNLATEGSLARTVRAMIRELKRQVIENIHFATHTDYDSSTGDLLNVTFVQRLPAIVLANFEAPDDPEYRIEYDQDFAADAGRFIERRPPAVVMVKYDLVGVSDDPVEILNLVEVVRTFFRKNPYLFVDRSSTDPSLGQVRYTLEWGFAGPVAVTHQGDNSNVESFGGEVRIRGVLLEDMPGISESKPVGIPATFPHEATRRYGHVSADDETAATVDLVKSE